MDKTTLRDSIHWLVLPFDIDKLQSLDTNISLNDIEQLKNVYNGKITNLSIIGSSFAIYLGYPKIMYSNYNHRQICYYILLFTILFAKRNRQPGVPVYPHRLNLR